MKIVIANLLLLYNSQCCAPFVETELVGAVCPIFCDKNIIQDGHITTMPQYYDPDILGYETDGKTHFAIKVPTPVSPGCNMKAGTAILPSTTNNAGAISTISGYNEWDNSGTGTATCDSSNPFSVGKITKTNAAGETVMSFGFCNAHIKNLQFYFCVELIGCACSFYCFSTQFNLGFGTCPNVQYTANVGSQTFTLSTGQPTALIPYDPDLKSLFVENSIQTGCHNRGFRGFSDNQCTQKWVDDPMSIEVKAGGLQVATYNTASYTIYISEWIESACLAIYINVQSGGAVDPSCGSETISKRANAGNQAYDPDPNLPAFEHLQVWFQSSSTTCLLESFQLLDSTFAPYSGSVSVQAVNAPPQEKLEIKIFIDLTVPSYQDLRLRVISKGGIESINQFQLRVCGDEVIQSSYSSISRSIKGPSTVNLDFTLESITSVTSTIPKCISLKYELVYDSIPTSGSYTIQPQSLPSHITFDPAYNFKYPQLILFDTEQGSIPTATREYFLKVYTPGTQSNPLYLPLYITKICGGEKITSTPSTKVQLTYQKDETPSSSILTFQSDNKDGCKISSSSLHLESDGSLYTGTDVTISSTDTFPIQTHSVNLAVVTTSPISSLALKVIAISEGAVTSEIPYDIVVCGNEIISPASLTITRSFTLNNGLQSLDLTTEVSSVTTDISRCSTMIFKIVHNQVPATGTYTDNIDSHVYISPAGVASTITSPSSLIVNVNTDLGPIPCNIQYYLKAYTASSITPRFISLDFDIGGSCLSCGTESITPSPATFIYTYEKSQIIGSPTLTFSSNDPFCGIQSSALEYSSDGAIYAGTEITKSSTDTLPIQNHAININIVTANPFHLELDLIAQSVGSQTGKIPLDIMVCGNEVVAPDPLSSVTIQKAYTVETGSKTFDVTSEPQMMTIKSNEPRCSTLTYELVTKTVPGDVESIYSGPHYVLAATVLSIDTDQGPINTSTEQHFLKISTLSGGTPYYVLLDIQINCGGESITATSNTVPTTQIVLEKSGTVSIGNLNIGTSSTICLLQSVQILDQSGAIYLGGKISITPQFSAAIQMIVISSVDVITNTPFTETFTLRGTSMGGKTVDVIIDVHVCGAEKIVPDVGNHNIVLYRQENSNTQTYDFYNDVQAYSSDDLRCTTINYSIRNNLFQTTTNPSIPAPQPSTLMDIDTTDVSLSGQQRYIRVYTVSQQNSNSWALIPLMIYLCGSETISADQPLSFEGVYAPQSGIIQINFQNDYLTRITSSKPECPINTFQLLDEQGNNYAGQEVIFQFPNLVIDTERSFQIDLKLDVKTEFGAAGYQIPLSLTVCGQELIDGAAPKPLQLSQMQQKGPKEISLSYLKEILISSNPKCPIQSFDLKKSKSSRDDFIDQSLKVEGDYLRLNLQRIVKELNIFLQVTTLGNVHYYVPLTFEVTKPPFMSKPPFFELSPQSQIDIDNLEGVIQLSQIMDDYSQFYSIQVSSSTLGAPVEYRNLSLLEAVNKTSKDNLKPLKNQNDQKILDLDKKLKYLTLRIPERNRDQYVGQHKLKLRIYDLNLLYTDYLITVNILQLQQKNDKNEDNNKSKSFNNNKYLKAMVQEIDQMGNLTIKFSTPMKTFDLNLTHINRSILDIYVQPEDDWHELYDEYNISRLNFTWNVTSYSKDQMNISMIFNNPEDISPLIDQDTLVFHILDPQYFFISETLLVDIHEDYRTLRHPIRKQIIPSETSILFLRSMQVASVVLLNSQIILYAISLVYQIVISQMFGMVNSLQIITHMMLLKVIFPANVVTMFSYLIPFVQFDILEQIEIPQVIFQNEELDNDFDEDSPLKISQQLQNLSYESHNPVLNLGTLGVLISFYIVKIAVLFLILRPLRKKYERIAGFYEKLYATLIFGEISTLVFEGQFELQISAYLAFQAEGSKIFDQTKVLSYTVAVISLITCFILVPAGLIKLATLEEIKNIKTVNDLQLGVNLKHKSKATFFGVFIVRRFLYMAICLYIFDESQYQLMAFCFLNLFMMSYIIGNKPLDSPYKNKIELFNEIIIYLCFTLSFTFTNFVAEQKTQYTVGWIVDFLVVLYILVHLIVLFGSICQLLKLLFVKQTKRYYQKIAKKKEEKAQAERKLEEIKKKEQENKENVQTDLKEEKQKIRLKPKKRTIIRKSLKQIGIKEKWKTELQQINEEQESFESQQNSRLDQEEEKQEMQQISEQERKHEKYSEIQPHYQVINPKFTLIQKDYPISRIRQNQKNLERSMILDQIVNSLQDFQEDVDKKYVTKNRI